MPRLTLQPSLSARRGRAANHETGAMHYMKDLQQTSPETVVTPPSTPKKPYVTPELTVHGTVEKITALSPGPVHNDATLSGSSVT